MTQNAQENITLFNIFRAQSKTIDLKDKRNHTFKNSIEISFI